MIGLDRKSAELAADRTDWQSLFGSEAKLLRESVEKYVAAIEHIGSTAVSGLEAKPIIDIPVGVRKFAEAEKCAAPLTEIGYEYKVEQGIAGRFYFRKGNADVSTHHLQIVEMTGDFWRTHLLFRDYLRQHPNAARDYGKLKRELSAKYKHNRPASAAAKAVFIERILKKADAARNNSVNVSARAADHRLKSNLCGSASIRAE